MFVAPCVKAAGRWRVYSAMSNLSAFASLALQACARAADCAGQIFNHARTRALPGYLWVMNKLCKACPCRHVPTPLAALAGSRVVAVAGGWRHTAAVDDRGRLFCWGWNKVRRPEVFFTVVLKQRPCRLAATLLEDCSCRLLLCTAPSSFPRSPCRNTAQICLTVCLLIPGLRSF